MRISKDDRVPEFHNVPLERVFLEKGLNVVFDDIEERRWKIKFKPYQAFRVVSWDCADDDLKIGPFLYEILDSEWIEELKSNITDETATFIEKAHHYVMALGNNVVEVIAFDNYIIERI